MTADCFQFQQFSLYQDRCAMKLGTDAILLGAWAEPAPTASHLLDMGTGTGVLSLMLAQENSQCQIDALEIDPDAVLQARANISASPWSERISVYQQAVQNWQPLTRYQLIICNPPYYQSGRQALDLRRRQARHDSHLSYPDLLRHARRLLAPEGVLTLILPDPERLLDLAAEQGFRLSRHCQIRHSERHPIRRHLLELSTASTASCQQQSLILKTEQNQWTPAYQQLTRKFHRRQCEV